MQSFTTQKEPKVIKILAYIGLHERLRRGPVARVLKSLDFRRVSGLSWFVASLVSQCGPTPTEARAVASTPRQERYAALECQNNEVFAIVNFYPDHTLKLSWGRGDTVIGEDVQVQQALERGVEMYSGLGVQLRLPVLAGIDSTEPRMGDLTVAQSGVASWPQLRCLLYAED